MPDLVIFDGSNALEDTFECVGKRDGNQQAQSYYLFHY